MELKTYDTILTQICDDFDQMIAPKTMFRTNSNILYLIFKAIAKSEEVINNLCVKVRNKFDPAYCSVEDLNSVADLVGTEKLKGSGSGVLITATNNSGVPVILEKGKYTYAYNDEIEFDYEQTIPEGLTVPPNNYAQFVAISKEYGEFKVTAQSDIALSADVEISPDLKFSIGTDNDNLLGETEETDLAFRKRILSDTTRQNSLMELQTKIKSKPYVFDCRLKFNNTLSDEEYEGVLIPSYHLAVFLQGDVREELAELIAQSTIYPTVEVEGVSTPVYYKNDIFLDSDGYKVNIIPFSTLNYKAEVTYSIDTTFTTTEEAEKAIRSALFFTLNRQVHQDYVKEADLYNIIEGLNLAGVELLNVDLFVDDIMKPYISVPLNKIAVLTDITFTEVGNV